MSSWNITEEMARTRNYMCVEYFNAAPVDLVRTSETRKTNGGCDVSSSMRFPQLARAFRVERRVFVYSFESAKSQTKLLQND